MVPGGRQAEPAGRLRQELLASLPGRGDALAVEKHEDWLKANCYINMKLLKEHKRELMKEAA